MTLEIETQEELEVARKAVEELRATRIRHIGRFPNRLKFDYDNHPNREKAFADHWRKENENVPSWLNGGHGVLEHLLLANEKECIIGDLTQRDAIVAATVIQWLGTNCGWCFLDECLNRCGYYIAKRNEPKR